MNEDKVGQTSLLDTTDCLEAVGVLRGWKNFLFIILFLCLLLQQAVFWAVNTKYITAEGSSASSITNKVSKSMLEVVGSNEDVQDVNEAAKQVVAEQGDPNQVDTRPAPGPAKAFFGITFSHLSLAITIANALLILGGMLYCLTILLALKVSLVGKLGGINHVCRAFFLSLIMIILLLPWQKLFGPVVIGAMYTPSELARCCSVETGDIFDIIIRYLRFTGYWLLILLLLIFAQLRTGRWTKTILRRLEVI